MLSIFRSLRVNTYRTTSSTMPRTRKASTLSDSQAVVVNSNKRTKLDDESRAASSSTLTNNDATFVARRADNPWKIGAHVSSAGGVENAITNAATIGANAFALFIKSQRKWVSPPFKEDNIRNFKARLAEHGYDAKHILPHGSYLINLGNPDSEKRKKSYDCFLDDLKRCEQLGLRLYNFHPGSTVGETTIENSISLIAQGINDAHKATTAVITVVENMAGAGNIVGSSFDHLASIIAQVEDKTRVGICLDTCHMFAAGYDIRTKEGWDETISKFDDTVGLSYLRGMHLNDSKTALASNKDRHENVGLGHVGLAAFEYIVRDPRVQDIPLILETPSFEKPFVWEKEIAVLNSLSHADRESDRHETLVDEINAMVKKAESESKKPAKRKATAKRGKKKAAENDGDDVDNED